MSRFLAILCLASVAVAQDRYWGSYTASYPAGGGGNSGSVAESRASLERAQFANLAPQRRTSAPRRAPAAPRAPAPSPPVVARVVEKSIYSTEEVEPGQYVHNPEWDLTPYQLWKRKQAAKKALQPTANSLPEPVRKVVTVRKQKQRAKPAAAAPQKSRFQNFKQVEQHRSAPVQQQPRREQAYFQPAPQQPVQPAYQQPAFKQQTFQQPQQPQRAAYQQPAYQQQQAYQQPQQVAAYPRAQHQTYTQEYILEANNNAQRIYSYTADKYQAKAEGGSYSYAALY